MALRLYSVRDNTTRDVVENLQGDPVFFTSRRKARGFRNMMKKSEVNGSFSIILGPDHRRATSKSVEEWRNNV